MKNKGYIFLTLISVLICIIAVVCLFNLMPNNKKNTSKLEIICEKTSPDASYTAIMFSVKGDEGSTPFQLSILPNGETVTEKDAANAFSYDGIYDVEWKNETTLLVKKYEEGTDYYRVEEYNGIKIKYLSPAETREHEKNKKGQ